MNDNQPAEPLTPTDAPQTTATRKKPIRVVATTAEPSEASVTNSSAAPPEAAGRDASPIVVVTPAPAKPTEQPAKVVTTWLELRGLWRVFIMSEWIMRDRASFFEEVRQRRDLTSKLRGMFLSSIIYLALYGLVLGQSNSWLQAVSSAIKLPVLFLVTLMICLPTLYFFNLLYGSQLTFAQTTALMMAAVTITGALTLAFASISLFFWITVPDYEFFLVLNTGILAITAWWGLSFLRQGLRHVQQGTQARQGRILAAWIAIYAFVGTQMAWALRPFFGWPGAPFEPIRKLSGTFYTGLFYNLTRLLDRIF